MSPFKYNTMPPEVLEHFLRLCHVRHYPAKMVIIRPGDVGDKLLFIVQGSVSVSVENDDGHELVLAYLNKNEFIGEIGIFRNVEPRLVCVKTRTECKIAEISYSRFKHALKTELKEFAVDIYSVLGEQLSARLLNASRKYCDLVFMDVEGRVARALLDLCREPDAMTHPDGMQLHITRQEIGRIVGCTREMAGRVLRELEEQGLIKAHGKTIVVYNSR